MAAHQVPPSLGFSRQEHCNGVPFPSPMHESEKWKRSRSVESNSLRPHGLQPSRLLHLWDFPGKSTGVGCHYLLCIQPGLYAKSCCLQQEMVSHNKHINSYSKRWNLISVLLDIWTNKFQDGGNDICLGIWPWLMDIVLKNRDMEIRKRHSR